MEKINQFIESNKDRFLQELFGLLRIPSISSQRDSKESMSDAAHYWVDLLLKAGADRAQVMKTAGHPVVYAEKILDSSKPTVLVYGHMDVMPVDPLDLWISPPFEPEIRDGRIWGRGANDDKGQCMMHAKAFEYLVTTNSLNCNIKFLIEGEEEIGSPNLASFCEEHKDLLRADVILVSDTTMIAPDVPSITVGLRGLAYWQVEVTGPDRDLHSGLFGGAVANPINELCKLIAAMTDQNNRITIPGFYDDVLVVDDQERQLLGQFPFDERRYCQSLKINKVQGETGYSTIERTGIRPSFDVCGIWGGFTGEGSKTVLPSKAYAKISSRLVPNQDYEKIAELFKKHFERMAPDTIKVEVTTLHGSQGYVCPINLPAYSAAEKACIDVFGRPPIPVRSGGSIGIVPAFERILGIKTILLGFGLDTDQTHSPNENFSIENFENGIRTIIRFYHHLL